MINQAFTYNQHFVAMMNVINAAKLNVPTEGHIHHIVPKCWFRMNNLPVDNSEENLVRLSYEDHSKVHKLATLCAASNVLRSRYAYAYHRLSKGETINNDYWRGENNPFFGKKHTAETRARMSKNHADVNGARNPFFGKTFTDEMRRHLSEANKGRVPWCKGKRGVYSEETLKKIGAASKGRIPANKGKHKTIVDGRVRYV